MAVAFMRLMSTETNAVDLALFIIGRMRGDWSTGHTRHSNDTDAIATFYGFILFFVITELFKGPISNALL